MVIDVSLSTRYHFFSVTHCQQTNSHSRHNHRYLLIVFVRDNVSKIFSNFIKTHALDIHVCVFYLRTGSELLVYIFRDSRRLDHFRRICDFKWTSRFINLSILLRAKSHVPDRMVETFLFL